MSVDFPRGWQIARSVPLESHNLECSYRATNGGFICDCEVLTQHPEYTDTILQGEDGAPCEQIKPVPTTCGISIKEIIEEGMIICGNCQCWRLVNDAGDVETCSNCGDEGWNLYDNADKVIP